MVKKGYLLNYGKLGSMLLEQDMITNQQLQLALNKQKDTAERLGNILVGMDFLTENDLMQVLARQLDIPYIASDSTVEVDPKVIPLIPEELARQYLAIPISKEGDELVVAMLDPFNVRTLDYLKAVTKHGIKPVVAPMSEINRLLTKYYTEEHGRKSLIRVLDRASSTYAALEEQERAEEVDLESLKKQVEAAPVVELVDHLVWNAINERASDIHVEPFEEKVVIHYRVDGILHEVASPPKHLQMGIISRLKILAGLDIAERRLPQDGRFTVRSGSREIDVRLSTLPTIFGEKVALRILERESLTLDLDKLGLDAASLESFRRYIRQPHGMILLTGPTGSGKTTALYSALTEINSPEISIITVEDPVEYRLAGVHQVQVNPKINLTFACGLRSILRQDPDIIMVGEIRDLETAEMAVRAALTGHLVFSTLHTTDSISTINRLIDIGVPAYMVCSVLRLATAQRLVRKICTRCKESYIPDPALLEHLGIEHTSSGENKFYYGRGCEQCRHTGYYGRVAIVELFEVNEETRNLILRKEPTDVVRRTAIEMGMTTLLKNGLQKAIDGITTIEEVLRVCIEDD